ncbi:hypothetical protein ESY86_13480 [Subsaximicrobium wynnwilliamsii]|uniref:Uncharacterized protein n=1 Tax=Subsaximicrobium wynnwilliamsii TaxID=291179 RepID=A0A5C6ZED1_9FLAO|nr:hypothetical protein [Subsaximicrobium wynnwilliamsii]TXD83198.1 hypothetical protein ESY87_10875 [Subsaximicrobium wynnwilliamsii]TXD88310.1 hypothetical protein ESY86_13480 [Subsaximicrobium wynnwilliamsii]TXE03031.1 hypothetical protein ESY88_09895 [Subsaximicrobium wynnwilliamsii]
MNNFAHIKPIAQYKKVGYYSMCINDNELSLFEEFIKQHTKTNEKKLDHILNWLKVIGNKYGAQTHHFRPEGETADASALPPKGVDRKPQYTAYGKKKANNLRLYCLRANEHIVFLFSGDIKTTNKAQHCPNVKNHFKLANQITKAIDNAFIDKDIVWNADFTQIECNEDFKIYF